MFNDTPNRLESVFIQRNDNNSFYEQINISGSNLIFYHDNEGKITADKILTWASLYNIGFASSSSISSSWTSQSLSSSYALTASYVPITGLTDTKSFATAESGSSTVTNNNEVCILNGIIIAWTVVAQ